LGRACFAVARGSLEYVHGPTLYRKVPEVLGSGVHVKCREKADIDDR
jgi:hypothetical protein